MKSCVKPRKEGYSDVKVMTRLDIPSLFSNEIIEVSSAVHTKRMKPVPSVPWP